MIDELPPLGPLDRAEETGVDEFTEETLPGTESEDVGLDDAESDEAALSVEDLFGTRFLAGEGQEWSGSNEAAEDQVGNIVLPESSEPEYGYTDSAEGPEPPSPDELGPEYAFTPGPSVQGDIGALGVEEEGQAGLFGEDGDDDVRGLPPLVDDSDVDNDLDLGRDVQVDGALTREDEGDPPLPPPALDVVVQWRGPADDAVYDVVRSNTSFYVLGSALQRCEGERSTIVDSLTGHAPTSLAFDGHRVFVATAGGAVLASPGFDPIGIPVRGLAPLTVAAEGGSTPRLWLWTRDGRLFRSEDHGVAWGRPDLEGEVAAFDVDPCGGVGALLVHRGYATFARSVDGGRHWKVADAPDPGHHPRENEQTFLSVFGPSVVIGHERSGRTYLSVDDGGRFEELEGLRTAGPLLVVGDRAETLAVFGGRAIEGRGVVVCWRRQSGVRLVLDVRAERHARGLLGRPGTGESTRIHGLRRDPHDSAAVFVGSGFGLFHLVTGGR